MSAISIGEDLIHYEVLGRGRPVILLHSWLGSWRYWIPTMQQLKINYKVYAIDLYGFGDSVKDPNKYSLEHQLRLLEDFVEKLGIPKMALVGHGLGALVAVEYARRYESRVPRMLISSAPLFDPGDLDSRATILPKVMASVRRPEPPRSSGAAPEPTVMSMSSAMRAALAEHASRKGTPTSTTLSGSAAKKTPDNGANNLLFKRLIEEKKVTPQKLLDMCFNRTEPEYDKLKFDVAKTDERAIVSSLTGFDAGEMLDTLRRLSMPIVVVHGKNDDVIEPPGDKVWHYLTADKEESLLPVLLDGVRHFPMLEYERFFRLLNDFLDTPDVTKLEIKERWKRRSH
ncbi:MAG TPA: alpha/beta hydrolase [Spirillospora sp.]|nr:alpha/beta hydrolase [Spirillospora sp.]